MNQNDTFEGWLIVVLLLLAWFLKLFEKKRTKQDLAKYYGISKPTLSKWMQSYYKNIKIEDWNKKRFLTAFEFIEIQKMLGEGQAVSKKDIVSISESNYKTVSDVVKLNLEKIGISLDSWENFSVFPPVIANRIIERLG